MEPESSLPHSQAHSTCPYPKPDQSSPYFTIPILEDLSYHFNTTLPRGFLPSLLPINTVSWRDLPGHRHGKLFIGKYCKKSADDLLRLSRHLLRLTVAIFTGHAPVRGHLYTMGLFDGDPTCIFCRKETETVQHIICCCEALARQRYNVFGNLFVEPKEISTASVRDLCLFIKGTGLL
jgi:hypothetical protein